MKPKEAIEKIANYPKAEEMVKEVYSKILDLCDIIEERKNNNITNDAVPLYCIMEMIEVCSKYSDVLKLKDKK